jgi:pyridoxamine 5'-phosphate oxidase
MIVLARKDGASMPAGARANLHKLPLRSTGKRQSLPAGVAPEAAIDYVGGKSAQQPAVSMSSIVDPIAAMTAAHGFTERDDPFVLFGEWLAEAEKAEPNDPNAVCLATVDAEGLPDARMVLLKSFDEAGFVFYTNRESAKGRELEAQPKAALCFHWKSLRRQVRVRGPVEEVTAEEADAYYASRARQSRIGAWASKQSRPLESRFALEKAVAKYAARYAVGEVPRPSYWTGFRIRPLAIEFWHERPFRLHDRVRFEREAPEGPWSKSRLYP